MTGSDGPAAFDSAQARKAGPHNTGSIHRLTLYSNPGCHLCDDMKAVIDRVAERVAIDLRVVDITGDADLEARYDLEIPLLMIDGRKAAKFRTTEAQLERRLRL
jgi:hypothetical protein